jgi:hypothetical protein
MVDSAIISIDENQTVCDSLRFVHSLYEQMPGSETALAFANGGDQNNDTIPERPVCEELGIELIDDLGKKIQSSSWLLEGKS